jgi:acetylornithine deacetylase/succinyl-diaminopimelate desuccinylase-like protein
MNAAMPQQLDAVRQDYFDRASSAIDYGRLESLLADLVDRHSPTGAEREICLYLAEHLGSIGLEARCDQVGDQSGNCTARKRGDGSGPSLLLYAPLDTHLDADPATDIPWIGQQFRTDMLPKASRHDGAVIGLGAANPKAMVAAIVEAMRCIVDAGIPLTGDAIVAFCGGGMPWLCDSRGAGLSSGVRHMLAHGNPADCGVIVKTWDDIYYEHPGLVWFRVTVIGSLGYAGVRGAPAMRNAVVPAADIILRIDTWLSDYADRHQAGQIRPEGSVSAVHAGWWDRPAFPPATASILVDVRLTPAQTVAGVVDEFGAFLDGLRPCFAGFGIEWEVIAECEAARTDPDHWIVRSAERGWRAVHGRPYPGATPMSGQSDAAALNAAGVPLVRIGFPFGDDDSVPLELSDGLGGMGYMRVQTLGNVIRQLIYLIVDTCTRDRDETGIGAHPALERIRA